MLVTLQPIDSFNNANNQIYLDSKSIIFYWI